MVTEEINEDDLYFICYMTERVAQAIHQPCSYVVNSIGKKSYAEGIIDFYNQNSTINDKKLLEVSSKIVEKNRKAYENLAKAEL